MAQIVELQKKRSFEQFNITSNIKLGLMHMRKQRARWKPEADN